MLEKHYLSVNIKSYIERFNCPRSLKDVRPILDKFWNDGPGPRGTLDHDIKTFLELDNEKIGNLEGQIKLTQIPLDVLTAMKTHALELKRTIPGWVCPTHATFKTTVKVRGVNYNREKNHERGHTIFFKPLNPSFDKPIPGVIVEVFAVFLRLDPDSADVLKDFIAVERFQPNDIGTDDPFGDYPDFGCSLWSSKRKGLEIIPSTNIVSHAIFCPWDSGRIAIKCLDRVSIFTGRFVRVLTTCTEQKMTAEIYPAE